MAQEIFGKKGEEPKNGKFALVLHKSPSDFSTKEMACGMMMAGVLADAEKLGLDVEKIHLMIDFKDTNHTLCFNMTRDPEAKKGGMAVNPNAHDV